MKVIFLDFNGVLDTWFKMDVINYENLQRLKYIVVKTGAKVVISSSIKNSFIVTNVRSKQLMMLLERLDCEGIEVVGMTPRCNTREEEIKKYLEEHPEVTDFVVIDDDYDMNFGKSMIKLPPQGPGQLGLDDLSTKKAIDVLGVDDNCVKLKKVFNNK